MNIKGKGNRDIVEYTMESLASIISDDSNKSEDTPLDSMTDMVFLIKIYLDKYISSNSSHDYAVLYTLLSRFFSTNSYSLLKDLRDIKSEAEIPGKVQQLVKNTLGTFYKTLSNKEAAFIMAWVTKVLSGDDSEIVCNAFEDYIKQRENPVKDTSAIDNEWYNKVKHFTPPNCPEDYSKFKAIGVSHAMVWIKESKDCKKSIKDSLTAETESGSYIKALEESANIMLELATEALEADASATKAASNVAFETSDSYLRATSDLFDKDLELKEA